jgi:hypothetical protein
MRRTLLALTLISLCAPVHADTVAPKPEIALKSSATVSGDMFVLSEIATIKAPADLIAKLSPAVMGRSPLEGATRTIGRGDVILKLRQAGIDVSGLNIDGSDSVTLTLADAPNLAPATTANSMNAQNASSVGAAPAASTLAAIAPVKAVALKAGDPVTLLYEDGPVSIGVQAALMDSAHVGDRVTVRTSISTRLISGVLVDAQTVKY